ncbi:class I tRNA ligase family protein, partial [Vibrio coralliilyticus]|uniref:class I tRNA ligase family protein n=1 Tax=Vibrio coralliilyticus TaxID=190893 RepID=UPI000BD07ACF
DPIDMIDGIDLESLVEKRCGNMMQPQLAKKIEKNTRKTFENGIEPYGTDALRFTLAAMASTGRDINWDMKRLEGYRNFCNKLWNASRYVLMNTEEHDCGMSLSAEERANMEFSLADKWIESQFELAAKEFNAHLDNYRLDMAANTLYEFIWNQFCDWYLELTKPVLWKGTEAQQQATRYMLITVLEKTLRLAHPVLPYITESIWQSVKPLVDGVEGETIMLQALPQFNEVNFNQAALDDIEWVKLFITSIRNLRAEYDINPGKPLEVMLKAASEEDVARLESNKQALVSLAKLESVRVLGVGEETPACATALVAKSELMIPMAGLIDKDAELARLETILAKVNHEISRIDSKLNNTSFTNNAPADVVEKEKGKINKYKIEKNKTLENIINIKNLV